MDTASQLSLLAGIRGQGRVWVDSVTLETVGRDVPATETRRVLNAAPPGCYRTDFFYCFYRFSGKDGGFPCAFMLSPVSSFS
jgi:hypothetical protein